MAQVRDRGLLAKRPGFYAVLGGVLAAVLAACGVAFALLGASWFQLIVAGVVGVVLTQAAFIAHEAGHRQVVTSTRGNERLARFLGVGVVGISYSWWTSKHTRHHGNPNTPGRDPDIERDTISFQDTDAARARGLLAVFTRRQGRLFFPALLLEGLNLHILGIRTLLGRGPVEHRRRELALLAVRFGLYLGLLFWMLPIGMAFAFLGVQLAVFGLYMGSSFAPNHVGMPLLDARARVDFLSKQVLTSRNVTGGRLMGFAMGGLDLQIEHHLFPSMPRPHLRRVRPLVRAHCAEQGIPYTQTSILEALRIVTRHLDAVGLAAPAFRCPVVAQYRAG